MKTIDPSMIFMYRVDSSVTSNLIFHRNEHSPSGRHHSASLDNKIHLTLLSLQRDNKGIKVKTVIIYVVLRFWTVNRPARK